MIEPIKLLHAADLHLDSPVAGLPPEQAAQRRQQARQLLEFLPRLCRRAGCRLVLLAGDLLDSGSVYRDTAEQLAAELINGNRARLTASLEQLAADQGFQARVTSLQAVQEERTYK